MFTSVHVVVAQSLPAYGAFDPWWVLLWLALMAGCLMAVAVVVALAQFASSLLRKRSQTRRQLRIPLSTDGTSNP